MKQRRVRYARRHSAQETFWQWLSALWQIFVSGVPVGSAKTVRDARRRYRRVLHQFVWATTTMLRATRGNTLRRGAKMRDHGYDQVW